MCTVHAPDSQGMADTGGALCATSATWEIVRLERTLEGADTAPGFWNGCQKPCCNVIGDKLQIENNQC